MIQIHGLPTLGPADILAPDRHRIDLHVGIASHNVSMQTGTEVLTLDGETHRVTLALYRGWRQGWETGIEVPYIRHEGGFLDSFIEGWHDFFGFSQGGRDQIPRNRLRFQYRHNGVDQVLLTESAGSLGDVRLVAGRRLTSPDGQSAHAAVRLRVTLPTGDSDRLLGSSAPSTALWFSARCHESRCRERLSWYGGSGVLWLGSGDILADQQRRLVAFGSAGLHWQLGSRIALQAQIDGHTPFYDSNISALGDSSFQLVLGGQWQLGERHSLNFGVAEDLAVDTAPDVAFHLGLRSWF